MSVSILDPTDAIHELSGHSGALDRMMEIAASDLVVAAALVLFIAWLLHPQGVRACVATVIAALAAVALSGVIGMVWDRPRPFVAEHFVPLISHGADASFPSDHVAALAAVATVMWFISRRLGVVSWALAAVVGFARVYVGVHWVTDIAGGAVLGFGCGVLAWWLSGRFNPAIEYLDGFAVRIRVRRKSGRVDF